METENSRRDVQGRLDQLKTELDDFEKKLGLPSTCPVEVVQESTRLMSLRPEQLRSLTVQDCLESSFILAQYSLYLQRIINRETASVRWAEESVERMIASQLPQQCGSSYQERRTLAIHHNDAARKAEEVRVQAQLKIDRISFLAGRIDSMARYLENLRWARVN